MKKFLHEILEDDKGYISCARIIALVTTVFLVIVMMVLIHLTYLLVNSGRETAISDVLQLIGILAGVLAALGGASYGFNKYVTGSVIRSENEFLDGGEAE